MESDIRHARGRLQGIPCIDCFCVPFGHDSREQQIQGRDSVNSTIQESSETMYNVHLGQEGTSR
eukprot:5047892-Amphidinium_carterae.1